MRRKENIGCLFVDIGGVLLTDGWGRHSRRRAAANFVLNLREMENRHHLNWDTHQLGKISLDEYLERVVFFEKRRFTRVQFRNFMFAQSREYPKMIALVSELKTLYALKIVVVSNEGRELNAFRIGKFKLAEFVDTFISSCFVHLCKPDAEIFHLALDACQIPARQVVYIENTPLFCQIANDMGIRSITHTDFKSTRAVLASLGLRTSEKVSDEHV